MIQEDFLNILCCPETKQDVTLAPESLVGKLNEKIRSGGLKNRAGAFVKETIEGGLLREDKKFLYPIRKDIPVMLIEEALSVEGLV